MVGVSEVMGDSQGTLWGQSPWWDPRHPALAPPPLGGSRLEVQGGSWEGVEGSRASIWGSQRGARSHSGDPRPPALPAPETCRLEVQRGPEERSLKCPRGQGARPRPLIPLVPATPKTGVQGVVEKCRRSAWGSRGRHRGHSGGPRPLVLPGAGTPRVGVQGGSWGGIPHVIQGSGWRSQGQCGGLSGGPRGPWGGSQRRSGGQRGGPQAPRPAGSGHTQAEGPGQF